MVSECHAGHTYAHLMLLSRISIATLANFFNKFVVKFAHSYLSQWICFPRTNDGVAQSMRHFDRMGAPGCIGLMDCVHIDWIMCTAQQKHLHMNGRQKAPSRVYEAVCDAVTWITSITGGAGGSQSDKTTVRQDRTAVDLQNGVLTLGDGLLSRAMGYSVYSVTEGREVVVREITGLYFLVDPGYHKLRAFQCNFPSSDINHIGFSQKIESIRKGIECTFGRLKRRWFILRALLEVHGPEVVDAIFAMCCILHNMLLDADGLRHRLDKEESWSNTNLNSQVVADREPYSFTVDEEQLNRLPTYKNILHEHGRNGQIQEQAHWDLRTILCLNFRLRHDRVLMDGKQLPPIQWPIPCKG